MAIGKLCLVTGAVALTVVVAPAPSLAWGFQGHEIVAALAWQYLTPKAQSRILNLLELDTDTLTAPDFVSRAPWADLYRNEHRDTGSWHYVDIPLSDSDSLADAEAAETPLCPHPTLSTSAAIGAPADDCIVDKIEQFQAELKNPTTPTAERLLALKFLIHLVGDIHQPLHASDNNDKGGNCVWIKDGARVTRLHGWWDTDVVRDLMGSDTPQSYAMYLKAQISNKQVRSWQTGGPALWAAQSAVLAHNVAYRLDARTLPTCAHENRDAPLALPTAYSVLAEGVAKSQLEVAGVRLASVLNTALQ